MARIRTIKPEFFDDENVGALSHAERLCYIGLWTQADKEGRLEDRPQRLKVRLFPFDNVDVEQLLVVLADRGFIQRYTVNGKAYAAIKASAWAKHQRVRADEPDSVIPPPPNSDGFVTPQSGNVTAQSGSDASQLLGKERKGKEMEGKGNGVSGEPGTSSPPTPASRTLMTFPTVGTKTHEWSFTEAYCAELSAAYPNLNVRAEVQHALQWVKANPTKRKTAVGMPTFLVNWLNRSTASGGSRGNGPIVGSLKTAGNKAAIQEFLRRRGHDVDES